MSTDFVVIDPFETFIARTVVGRNDNGHVVVRAFDLTQNHQNTEGMKYGVISWDIVDPDRKDIVATAASPRAVYEAMEEVISRYGTRFVIAAAERTAERARRAGLVGAAGPELVVARIVNNPPAFDTVEYWEPNEPRIILP